MLGIQGNNLRVPVIFQPTETCSTSRDVGIEHGTHGKQTKKLNQLSCGGLRCGMSIYLIQYRVTKCLFSLWSISYTRGSRGQANIL